jgi:hypothetical protein
MSADAGLIIDTKKPEVITNRAVRENKLKVRYLEYVSDNV